MGRTNEVSASIVTQEVFDNKKILEYNGGRIAQRQPRANTAANADANADAHANAN